MPKLAPGVLNVIAAEPEEKDTVTGPRELVELSSAAQQWTPHYHPSSDTLYEIARQITIRRPVWQLEFAFKTVRLVNVGGKRVWYLLYRIRNTGGHLKPVTSDGVSFELQREAYPVRFFPSFVLRDHERGNSYADQIVPEALARIHAIEIRDPNVRLFDSVTISSMPIEVSTDSVDRSVWGVATWTDVDRRIDFFSIYVQGLTNAYRWRDDPDAFQSGEEPGTGRQYFYKTLQLNFWRPGDAVYERAGEFRYGLPSIGDDADQARFAALYGMTDRSKSGWSYRP